MNQVLKKKIWGHVNITRHNQKDKLNGENNAQETIENELFEDLNTSALSQENILLLPVCIVKANLSGLVDYSRAQVLLGCSEVEDTIFCVTETYCIPSSCNLELADVLRTETAELQESVQIEEEIEEKQIEDTKEFIIDVLQNVKISGAQQREQLMN